MYSQILFQIQKTSELNSLSDTKTSELLNYTWCVLTIHFINSIATVNPFGNFLKDLVDSGGVL